jgi:hypothetical protein
MAFLAQQSECLRLHARLQCVSNARPKCTRIDWPNGNAVRGKQFIEPLLFCPREV